MKVFTASQIRQLDQATITLEPVSSLQLMERASRGLCNWILGKFDTTKVFYFFCGSGNNGGDGLALARMLLQENYTCRVFLSSENGTLSPDAASNLLLLKNIDGACIETLGAIEAFPEFPENAVLVDALFGSGLSRPVTGFEAAIIDAMNASGKPIIAIDIPSGLFAEDNTGNIGAVIRACYTLSFEAPFLSFFFSENEVYTGQWFIIGINLYGPVKEKTVSPYYWVEAADVKKIVKQRGRFSHKGNFGHALLVAGSKGKTGAAILAARACLRAGCGLLTCHVPLSSYPIIQAACPEAMSETDEHTDYITHPGDTEKYDALGIGPGLGTQPETAAMLINLIANSNKPLLLDADALNIIALNSELLDKLPENSILTPHPGEFRRLFGNAENSFAELEKQGRLSQQYKIIIVRKGACTATTLPDGSCYFNSTGNPGMATAGSGDVLSGVILSLLAQHYKPGDAAIAGVFLHGLSGDLALLKSSQEALIAGDIADGLGAAFNFINELR